MFSNKKKSSLSIYVAHGGVIIIKTVARRFSDNEVQVLATYDDGMYTILKPNIKTLSNFLAGTIAIPSTPVDQTAFVAFINQLKSLMKISKVRLICDANLGEPHGENVTPALFYLKTQINPHQLFPFTNTAQCIENAKKQLPNIPVTAANELSDRMASLIDNESSSPSPINHDSWRSFSHSLPPQLSLRSCLGR